MIQAHIRMYGNVFRDPSRARDQCRIAAIRLVSDSEGTPTLADAQIFWLAGSRIAGKSDTSTHGEHAVVCVRNSVLLDLTRRQFDGRAEIPTVYEPVGDAVRDWLWIVRSENPEGALEKL